jgi:hypothetical protein
MKALTMVVWLVETMVIQRVALKAVLKVALWVLK